MALQLLLSCVASCLALTLCACGTAVPDLKGLTYEQADKALTEAGFELGDVSYREDADGAVGAVMDQSPAAGRRASSGSVVDIVIAGPAPVETPDLTGMNRETAEGVLSALGLIVGSVSESHDATATVGAVISQEPAPGVETPKGSGVDLVLSKGPEPKDVPSVEGATEAEAKAILEAAGLSVEVRRQAHPATKDSVIAQDPAAGASAKPGATVTITVSTGEEYVSVPDFVAKGGESEFSVRNAEAAVNPVRYGDARYTSRYDAIAAEAGVKVQFVHMSEADSVFMHGMGGWPVGQDPAPGTRVKRGTTVRLVVMR